MNVFTMAREIWEAIQQTYSKVRDSAQIFEIKVKILATKQGTRSVTEYANIMKHLWPQIDYYQNTQMKFSKDAIMVKKIIERERIFEFLVELNVVFDQV